MQKPPYPLMLLLMLLLLSLALPVLAQTTDFDTEKPLDAPCSEPLYVPNPDKAAMETCASEDDSPMEEKPYEKSDSDDARIALQCGFPETITVRGGDRDLYAQPGEPASRPPSFDAPLPRGEVWSNFDDLTPNRHFGHQFDLRPHGLFPSNYLDGILVMYVQPLDGLQNNDIIWLWVPGATGRGWSANMRDLRRTVIGQDIKIELDLRTLATSPTTTILTDLREFGMLNIHIQDDMAVDSMSLTVACHIPPPVPTLVGVIPTRESGCGPMRDSYVYMDNEDRRNANNRDGWIGGIISDNNTLLRLCAVDGILFEGAATAGANFALVSLGSQCPAGFSRFDRWHDNEDNRTESWDDTPSGSATVTAGSARNTNLAFCVATGTQAVDNSAFPSLGAPYGVWGGRDPMTSPWALLRGWFFIDDEDHKNANAPATGWGRPTDSFVELGKNTRYYVSRVK